MGRLIDEIEIYKRLRPKVDNGTLDEIMLDIPTVEAIPKADYENRLKADVVAMLTELQLEIDEKATELCDDGWWLTYNYIIQQKINSLKGEV